MISIKDSQSIKRLLLALVGAIFVGETLVMLFIDMLPPLSHWHTALLDAVWLLMRLSIFWYFARLRPN